ncbi:hypothetical protein SAMN05660226_04156 [Parapedobacter luteus]|uniref:Uncharacterized protein n=1 Tax=Parapedobacter luteus TaxID=623280 RepID=A0A1T5FRX9_9SPHI|nr:hypothetical protein SAMN05660226_04156 [Parapedobacter luteus]
MMVCECVLMDVNNSTPVDNNCYLSGTKCQIFVLINLERK